MCAYKWKEKSGATTARPYRHNDLHIKNEIFANKSCVAIISHIRIISRVKIFAYRKIKKKFKDFSSCNRNKNTVDS